MKVLDRYIGKTVLNATILVFLVFVGLRLVIGIFGELGALGEGQYGFLQAAEFVVLNLPLYIYQLYPNIALLGALAALGLLASNNELTVVRTSGVSIAKISISVLKVALVLTIIMTFIGEYAAPPMAAYAQRQKDLAQHGSMDDTQNNVWLREGNSFINIGVTLPDGSLKNITRFEFNNNNQLLSASYAKTANFIAGQWLFHDIVYSNISPTKVTTGKQTKISWPMKFKPHLFIASDPNLLTLKNLQTQIKSSVANGLDPVNYQLAFWMRILQPLATLVMVFLAIPFIFGPLRSSTMGLRMLSGVMVGLAFYIVNRFFGPFSIVYQIPPIVAAIIPIILFAALGVYLMRRKG